MSRAWVGALCQPAQLRRLAVALHGLFTLLHGSINSLLEQVSATMIGQGGGVGMGVTSGSRRATSGRRG
jgi:hypothetical protein